MQWTLLTTTLSLAPPAVDRLGDPLPPGAVMRLGTARLKHSMAVTHMALSPDGKRLASAGISSCFVWDTETGKLVLRLEKTHEYALAWTPDGRGLLGARKHVVSLWDITTGKEERSFTGLHSDPTCVASSRDGTVIAAGDFDGHVILWDRATGKRLHAFHCASRESSMVLSLAFSPDGKQLAVGGLADSIQLREVESGKLVHEWKTANLYQSHEGVQCRALHFLGDGDRLVAGLNLSTSNYRVCLLDRKRPGVLRQRVELDHWSVALVPDGILVAARKGVCLLDPETWMEKKYLLKGVWGYGMAVSENGSVLASVSHVNVARSLTSAIRLWNLRKECRLVEFQEHTDGVTSVKYLPDGKTIVSGSGDGTVRFWDAQSGKQLRKLDGGEDVERIALSRDGTTLASLGDEHLVHVWSLKTLERISFETKRPGKPSGAAFGADSRSLLTIGSVDYDLEARDLIVKQNRTLLTSNREADGYFSQLTCSPGGDLAALGMGDGHVLIHHLLDNRTIRRFENPDSYILDLAFSPEATLVAAATSKKTPDFPMGWKPSRKLVVWDTLTRKRVAETSLDSDPEAIDFSPCGSMIAVALHSGPILLIDPATGKECGKLPGHQPGEIIPCGDLAFSPDGKRLVSAGSDHQLLVWDVSRFSRPHKPRPLNKLWDALGDADGTRSYRALQMLLTSPSLSGDLTKLLAKAEKEVEPRVARYIADLDSKQFATRSRASEELVKLGPLSEPAIRRFMSKEATLEQRRRVEVVLAKVCEMSLDAVALRVARARALLKVVGPTHGQ